MAFTPVNDGDLAVASQVQQIIDALQGVAGAGQQISLTALDSDDEYALVVQNLGTGGAAKFLSSSGTTLFDITDAGFAVTTVSVGNGTAAAPSLTFTSDTNTGLYRVGADSLGVSAGGSERLRVTTSGASVTGDLTTTASVVTGNGSAADPGLWIGDVGAFYRSAAGRMGLAASGTVFAEWDTNATPGGPRLYISEGALAKTALLLGRGTSDQGITPDGTYSSLLLAQSYQADPGEGLKGSVYAVDAQTAEGFLTAIQGVVEATSGGTWAPPVGLHGMIGLLGNAQSYRNGTRLWGGDLIARQFVGSGSDLTGLEVGVEVGPTASVTNRYGVQIVTLASGGGTVSGENIGLKFADKMDPTDEDNLWDYCIGFGSPNIGVGTVGVPLKSTGTLMRVFGSKTIANGIDFTGSTFSGFQYKSDSFMISSIGRLGVRVNAVTAAPLRLNADGDTWNFSIDSPVTAASAGAVATYMVINLNGTTYHVPCHAVA